MNVEKVHNDIRYTLSNENLNEGDKVYPIAWGRCLDNGGWILHNIDFREFTSGFPNEPHKILDIKHSDYKPYEVRTDNGYGPKEIYYKVIKMEKLIQYQQNIFITRKWEEFPLDI